MIWPNSRNSFWQYCAAAVFVFSSLRHVQLPGIYMDAVNPDYLVSYLLNPAVPNHGWVLPNLGIHFLAGFYYGVQHYWLGIPVFWFFGSGSATLYLFHAAFGLGIILLVFRLIQTISGNTWIAGFTAALLGSDIAFISAFRTQFFITLAGSVWFLAGLLVLGGLSKREAPPSSSRVVWSGIFYGLAVYSYFIYLFYLPALLVLIWKVTTPVQKGREVFKWGLGFALGLSFYVAGYVSMAIELGGFRQTVDFLKSPWATLAPLRSNLDALARLQHALQMTYIAATNTASELLIFGAASQHGWATIRLLFLGSIVLIACGLYIWTRDQKGYPVVAFTALILSYIVAAASLGNRLWAHHFIVLLPMIYTTAGLAIAFIADRTGQAPKTMTLFGRFVVAAFLILIVFNIQTQNRFFDELTRTGGAGKFSDAIDRFSVAAISRANSTVYMFPEWGFMMSFAYLTENRVRYLDQFHRDTVVDELRRGKEVVVATWTTESANSYAQSLRSLGARVVTVTPNLQRDAKIAFYSVEAR